MQSIITLLMVAISLLNQANATHASPELKNQAITVANTAIDLAQKYLSTSEQSRISIPSTSNDSNTQFGAIIPAMKPSYTYDELLHLFHSETQQFTGQPEGYADYKYVPVSVSNIASTSVTIGVNDFAAWDKKTDNGGELKFNGDTIFNGVRKGTGSVILDNLNPGMTYSYRYIYHEDGRESTVVDGKFNTLDQ